MRGDGYDGCRDHATADYAMIDYYCHGASLWYPRRAERRLRADFGAPGRYHQLPSRALPMRLAHLARLLRRKATIGRRPLAMSRGVYGRHLFAWLKARILARMQYRGALPVPATIRRRRDTPEQGFARGDKLARNSTQAVRVSRDDDIYAMPAYCAPGVAYFVRWC